MKLRNTVITVLLAALMLTGCAISTADPVKPAATQPSSTAVKPTETATPAPTPTETPEATSTPEPAKEANAVVLSPKYTSAPIFDAATNKEAGQVFKGFALPIESQKDGNANFAVSIVDEKTGAVSNKEFYIPISYLTKGYVEPEATILMISTDTIVLHAGAPIYDKAGKELAKFTDDLGPMYYIQKTDMGYQLVIGMNVVYIREKDADLISAVKQPQTANALLVSPKYKSAPFFDAKTKKEAGQIFHGFALQIESQKNGNGTFTISVDEKGNPVNREFYIPIKYLTKGYVEPQTVIEIISMDSITLHAGASLYSEEGNSLAKFNGKLGPMHFIQKTDKGYQLLIGLSVVYIKEKDADFIRYKKK